MSDLRTLSRQLLPCPFCGGDAHLAWYNNGDKQIVAECENPRCMSAVCGSETAEEAVARWNNRVKTIAEASRCLRSSITENATFI